MNVADLTITFASYALVIASHEWAREDVRVPKLLRVAPVIAQEKRMQRVAQAILVQTSGLVICTTTEVLLNEYGPCAPIWLQGTPVCDGQGELPDSLHRYGWSQMIPASNAM